MSSVSILAYIILSLSVGYAFIYSPMGDLNTLINQKREYGKSLETVSNIETKKNELLTQFNNISEADKNNIETFLPSSLNFVRFISQIDAVAASHGISIDKISSKNVSPSAGSSVENAEPQQSFNTSIVGFSFTASYEAFNAFMEDLEKSLRILDINSIKLAAGKDGAYSYDVEFKTYWLK